MKYVLLVVCTLILAVAASGQTSPTKVTDDLTLDAGVVKHNGLDDVYRRFSKGYRDLDHAAVADLYTKTAAYLPPDGMIQVGSEPILKGFKDFFYAVRTNGERHAISFQIVQRTVRDTMAYDVGIFTLKTFKGEQEVRSGQGKFIVVALREGDRWRFQVDGYSDMPRSKPTQE